MLQEVRNCRNMIKNKFTKPLKMTDDDEQHFKNAKVYHICEKEYSANDKRVRDHCHITGKYCGSAHESCNLNFIFKLKDKIPVIFHNLRGYESHLIMQQIGDVVKKNTFKNSRGKSNKWERDIK